VRRATRAALIAGITVVIAAACTLTILRSVSASQHRLTASSCPRPPRPRQYIGVITGGPPGGAELATFTHATGVHPTVVSYFVRFGEPWNPAPACRILRTGALPIVQINPRQVSLAAIAAGRRNAYLTKYAQQIRAFGRPLAVSFGHEMNGYWYSWGFGHTPPGTFVAAWRDIVNVFRQQDVHNVTWLWTVNIFGLQAGIPSPAAWWPGNGYVNWVGIDGYYYKPSWTFASLFGPTIKVVRALTLDPILITETAVAPAAGQPAKIADLVAGVRSYGLLGFIWYDGVGFRDWRLLSPSAIAAFHQGAESLTTPAS
jgi:hypothetical protein